MIVLFDFDSLLYKCCYRIFSYSEIKSMLTTFDKSIVSDLIVEASLSRLENQTLAILKDIEDLGLVIDSQQTEYYITECRNSFRKQISKEYKAKRKRNKWVSLIRERAKELYDAKYSDTHEADDLIAIRARELGESNCIIVSMDKDLKQIVGIHYDYYRDKETKQTRGLSITTKETSTYLFCYLMIAGDSSDNIAGIKRFGEKKTNKLLLNKSRIGMMKEVVNAYRSFSTREQMKINYKLIKI